MIVQAMPYPAGGGATYGSHTHWRLRVDSVWGSTFRPYINEVEFLDADGNAVTGGTVIYSSQTAGNEASDAFDGILSGGNGWWAGSGATSPEYIGLQYATAQEIVGLRHRVPGTAGVGANADYSPKRIALEYSDDGVTWTEAFAEDTFPPVTGNWYEHPRTEPDAGYAYVWRIYADDTNSSSGIAIDEVEFRATSGGADQTSPGAHTAQGRIRASSGGTSGNEYYKAFNDTTGSGTSWWNGSPAVGGWIEYIFPTPVKVEEIALTAAGAYGYEARMVKNFRLQESNDLTTYTDQKTFGPETSWGSAETRVFSAV